MSYVFWNIFWCLLAAAFIGAVVGWLLKHFLGSGALSELESSWQSKYATLESERDRLISSARETDTQLTSWKTKFSGLDNEFGKLRADFAGVSAKLPDLEGQLANWARRASGWESEKTQLAADLQKATDGGALLSAQLAEWGSKAQAWTGERTKLSADLEACRRKTAEAEAKAADLDKKLAELAVEGKVSDARYEKQIVEIRAQLDAAQKLRAESDTGWQTRFTSLENDRNTFRMQLGDLTGRASRAEADLTGRIKDLEAQLSKAVAADKADDDAYEQQIAALKADLADRNQRIERLIEQDKANDTRYEKHVSELRAQLGTAEAKLAGAQQQHDQAVADDKADDAAYEAKIGELTAAIGNLQSDLASTKGQLEKTINDGKTGEAEYQGKIGELESLVAKLKNDLASTKGQLDKAVADDKADDAAYQSQINDLTSQLAGTRRQLEQTVAEDKAGRAAQEKQIADLNSQFTRTLGELSETKAQLEKAIAGGKAGNAAYEDRIAALEGQLKAATAAAAEMVPAADLTALQARFDRLSSKYDALAGKPADGDIERIEGIGSVYGQKLRSIGIAWVRELLVRGGDPAGRAEIAERTGIKPDLILTWVNAADLLRVDGVTEDWAELLEAAGVDTVKELRNRVPANLHNKLVETNPTGPGGRYAPTLPSLEEVESWVAQAKGMRVRVTHKAASAS